MDVPQVDGPRRDRLLSAAFEVAGVGVGFIGADGRLLEANPALCSMLGYGRDELVGRPWPKRACIDEGKDAALPLDALFPETGDAGRELSIRRRDGSTLHALVGLRRIVLDDGAAVEVVCLTDIGDRKRAEDESRRIARSLEQRVSERTAELNAQLGALQVTRNALAASEARYRYLVEHVAESIVVLQDERVVFCNPQIGELLDYPPERIVGRSLHEFVHPEDAPMLLDRHRRRLAGEAVPSEYPLRVVRGDGRMIWIELRVTLVSWQGRPAALGLASNVEERRALEDRLRRTVEERETILDNAIVGIFFVDSARRIQWANRSALQMLGIEAGQLPGLAPAVLFPDAEGYDELVSRASEAMREGRDFREERLLQRGDGSTFRALVSGKIVGAWGMNSGSVWSVLDIGERKALEARLREKTSELEVIVHNALVGIAYTADRVYRWVNRKLCEMLGYPEEELLGRPTRALHVSERSWRALGEACEPVLRRGEAFEAEWPLRRKDGSTAWALLHGRAIDPSEPSLRIIWTMLDITERRRAYEDMERALAKQRELNELKSRFVSMTSHEFRTPLAAILSSAELLRDFRDRLPPAEQEELLGIVQSSVRRMSRMLDDVLAIGRAESQVPDFDPGPVQLRPLVESVIADSRRAAADAGAAEVPIELAIAVDDAPRAIDERHFRHILGNLLTNAIKYSNRGTPVRVEVSEAGRSTVLAVVDQGIGIPEEHLPHLFEPFYRARNVGHVGGTGLGMAIVRRAVESHRGTIEVSSRVGEGTRVVVALPHG